MRPQCGQMLMVPLFPRFVERLRCETGLTTVYSSAVIGLSLCGWYRSRMYQRIAVKAPGYLRLRSGEPGAPGQRIAVKVWDTPLLVLRDGCGGESAATEGREIDAGCFIQNELTHDACRGGGEQDAVAEVAGGDPADLFSAGVDDRQAVG